jgi:predicted metal-dependent RNase
MIRITPYGAAGEVTGSAYLLETDEATISVCFKEIRTTMRVTWYPDAFIELTYMRCF